MKVWIVITARPDCEADMEVMDAEPTSRPADHQRVYIAFVNGGDSLDITERLR